MQYLLPQKYHGYSGKKHGIVDTGQTIEFWCKQTSIDRSDLNLKIHLLVRKELCRRFVVGQEHKEGHCMKQWQHFVTLNIHPDLGKELGVFLHLDAELLKSMRLEAGEVREVPRSPEYYTTDMYQIHLGVVPHNHNIHRLLAKSLHIVGKGRVHKVQVKQAPCSLKVIFPYGSYRYDDCSKLIVDNAKVTKDRFDDLMLNEEE